MLGRVLYHVSEQQDVARYALHGSYEVRVDGVRHQTTRLEPRGQARLLSHSQVQVRGFLVLVAVRNVYLRGAKEGGELRAI